MLDELDRPAEEHPSRPRSNSIINAEIEQMIAELRTREEEHQARVEEIRHSMPFFEADANLFHRAGILGSREAVRLQSMSRNAATRDPNSGPLTPAGKRFVDQLPVADENDFPDEISCGICMESYGSTDEPESRAKLSCGHLMGRKCIERWLETRNTCPFCRRVLYDENAESPDFLELQEILQRLGPAVTTLYLRMLDHVTYSGTSGATEPSRNRRIEETVSSIEGVMTALREARGTQPSFGTNPSPNATTPGYRYNPEEFVASTEEELEDTWEDIVRLRHQYEALEVRVAAYSSDAADGLLGPESDAGLEQLRALRRRLSDDWTDFQEDLMDMPGNAWENDELLGPERLGEFHQLRADLNGLYHRLHRREEMMDMHGDSISGNE